jgi:glucose/arabinose dehydrogenase
VGFVSEGRLLVGEKGYEEGGVGGVFAAPDLLWSIPTADAGPSRGDAPWLGWPDFSGDEPLTWQDRYAPVGGPPLRDLLLQHPGAPPAPAARLACHASVAGLAVSTSERFGFAGQVFVAQFGDLAPLTGKVLAPVGFDVVRVDPATGVVREFASNAGPESGPATKLGRGGFERPIDVAFGQDGDELYVLDFGVLLVKSAGFQPCGGTGALWRITREVAPREAK